MSAAQGHINEGFPEQVLKFLCFWRIHHAQAVTTEILAAQATMNST